jgi:hypothetical protein
MTALAALSSFRDVLSYYTAINRQHFSLLSLFCMKYAEAKAFIAVIVF